MPPSTRRHWYYFQADILRDNAILVTPAQVEFPDSQSQLLAISFSFDFITFFFNRRYSLWYSFDRIFLSRSEIIISIPNTVFNFIGAVSEFIEDTFFPLL